jgi:hypothetical protein
VSPHMRSKDRKILQNMIADEIMSKPGRLARVEIRRVYSAAKPFEEVQVWFALADGTEHDRAIHLSQETIYSTPWNELAKVIAGHLEA